MTKCDHSLEKLIECLLGSDCVKNGNSMKECLRSQNTPDECQTLREHYFRCRHSIVRVLGFVFVFFNCCHNVSHMCMCENVEMIFVRLTHSLKQLNMRKRFKGNPDDWEFSLSLSLSLSLLLTQPNEASDTKRNRGFSKVQRRIVYGNGFKHK